MGELVSLPPALLKGQLHYAYEHSINTNHYFISLWRFKIWFKIMNKNSNFIYKLT